MIRSLVCDFLLFVPLTLLISFNAYSADDVAYVIEAQKKEYLGRESIDYPQISIVATRGSDELSSPHASIELFYLDKFNSVIGKSESKIQLRNCQRSSRGERCAFHNPQLDLHLSRVSCRLEVRIGKFRTSVPWGQCEDPGAYLPNTQIQIELVPKADDELNFVATNVGSQPTKPFRILVSYLAADGSEISYEFISVKDQINPHGEKTISILPTYLFTYACRLRVSVDPDHTSRAKSSNGNLLFINYGDCIDDSFVPYVDLSISTPTIEKIRDEKVLIKTIVTNIGDQAVEGRALEVLLSSLDNRFIKERFDISGHLGPKEKEHAYFVIDNWRLERTCMLQVEVNATGSVEEGSINNNKKTINLCPRGINVSVDEKS